MFTSTGCLLDQSCTTARRVPKGRNFTRKNMQREDQRPRGKPPPLLYLHPCRLLSKILPSSQLLEWKLSLSEHPSLCHSYKDSGMGQQDGSARKGACCPSLTTWGSSQEPTQGWKVRTNSTELCSDFNPLARILSHTSYVH